ncbi:MAG: extracellular solute-binding protein, partial [Chlorobi bacterium]|nr:extracellular solute-binding protein [Chlorobiota bacterium]
MGDEVKGWNSIQLDGTGHAARMIVLASALLVFLLSCGGRKAKDAGTPTVTFNCPANALQIKALEEEIPAFTKKTGIEVKLNPFSGEEKLYAMLAADQAPDIFYTNTVVRDKLAAEGYLLDLRSVSKGDPFLLRLRPEVIERGKAIDGGWYSISNWEFT